MSCVLLSKRSTVQKRTTFLGSVIPKVWVIQRKHEIRSLLELGELGEDLRIVGVEGPHPGTGHEGGNPF